MKAPATLSPSRQARAAFTLAEVLFTMVITSFAILTLVAVLPQGLESLVVAERRAAEARIVSHIAAMAQARPWEALTEGSDREWTLLFDASGNPLAKNAPASSSIHQARVRVLAAEPLPNESTASPFLRRLQIRIVYSPGGGSSAHFGNPRRYRERSALVANFDRTAPAAVQPPEIETGTGTTANP